MNHSAVAEDQALQRPRTTSEPVLQVDDFTLSFSDTTRTNLIEGVSFRVERGKTLCIVGESGCGKSVTSLALMGLLPLLLRVSAAGPRCSATKICSR